MYLKISPGQDGLTSRLYKVFTKEFCSILAKSFNHFGQGGKLLNSFFFSNNQTAPEI